MHHRIASPANCSSLEMLIENSKTANLTLVQQRILNERLEYGVFIPVFKIQGSPSA
jgi:hypothetical protein